MTQGRRTLVKVGGVVAACGALGAGGAYVGNATSPSSSSAASAGEAKQGRQHDGMRRGGLRSLRRAVHAEAVVPTQDGKFATVTLDRGTVEKVDGRQLTLKEGTPQATYKTVTLEIASDAMVRVNRRPGKLADVKAGQRAIVVRGAGMTRVLAHDARRRGPR